MNPPPRPPWSRPLAGLVTVTALIAIAAFVLPRLKDGPPDARRANCDLNRETCSVALDATRRVELSIEPRPVAVMKPLALELRTFGFAAPASAQIDFDGVSMSMGFNRTELHRDKDAVLRGTTTLPVCVSGTMEWRAELAFTEAAGTRLQRIEFRFVAPLPAP